MLTVQAITVLEIHLGNTVLLLIENEMCTELSSFKILAHLLPYIIYLIA